MPHLITTQGVKSADDIAMMLPHEHVFVDLRTWDQPGYAEGTAQDVITVMAPEIERAKAAGITALVECTPLGVGRRVDLVKAVSDATAFPIVVPTGIYREPWVTPWAHQATEDELYRWMLSELTGTIEDSGVQAAWIKLSAGDDGITDCEAKILRAAARAAKETGAVIGSHTIRGRVVREQLAIIEAQGYSASRFIWIHAQAEPDFALNLEMARRGAWIEYDWIGGDGQSDADYIERIQKLIAAGLEQQILISHDRGWYDAGNPQFQPRPFTYISEVFVPALLAAGCSTVTLDNLTRHNPFRAFAR